MMLSLAVWEELVLSFGAHQNFARDARSAVAALTKGNFDVRWSIRPWVDENLHTTGSIYYKVVLDGSELR